MADGARTVRAEPAAAEARDARYREARWVTLVGSAVDLALGVAKIVFGVVAHSAALVADGVHSLSDLLTDVMVLVAARHASRAADEDHPYGHGRIETLMTVALGGALILVAAGIALDAVRRMFEPERLLHPGWAALAVATVSIFAKEAIYHYTMRAARRLRSNLLRANAWHSRSDAISSVVVVIGVGGAMAGLDYLDAVAAVGVAAMVAKIGWDLAWHSVRELVDTGLEPERVQALRAAIRGAAGVRDLHLLRTRRMGADTLVDVHIQVDPRVSVSEGHQVGEEVRRRLMDEFEDVSDVMVHIDPENDEEGNPYAGLPLRDELEPALRRRWSGHPLADAIERIDLHYVGGRVHVEVHLPAAVLDGERSRRDIVAPLVEAARGLEGVAGVRACFCTRENAPE